MIFLKKKIKTRFLKIDDLQKISRWIINDAQSGVLFKEFQKTDVMLTMLNAMRDSISGIPFCSYIDGKYEERIGTVWICESQKKETIGYALLYEKCPGSINTDVELKLFHIDENHRRKGCATAFLKSLEEKIKGSLVLHAECLPVSIGMQKILEKDNFKIIRISPFGKKTYEKKFG